MATAFLRLARTRRSCGVLLLLAFFCGAVGIAAAQEATVPAVPAPAHKTAHKRKPVAKANVAKEEVKAAVVAPSEPVAPPAPVWPMNEKPTKAAITWNSQGLTVEANNSSLAQILEDVATVTGASIEGFEVDRRIFGVYGPGKAREILSQILQGTGYNIVMVGDLGQGAPRQIVLTLRTAGKDSKATEKKPNGEDDDSDSDEAQPQQAQPPQPPPNRMPQQFAPRNPGMSFPGNQNPQQNPQNPQNFR